MNLLPDITIIQRAADVALARELTAIAKNFRTLADDYAMRALREVDTDTRARCDGLAEAWNAAADHLETKAAEKSPRGVAA